MGTGSAGARPGNPGAGAPGKGSTSPGMGGPPAWGGGPELSGLPYTGPGGQAGPPGLSPPGGEGFNELNNPMPSVDAPAGGLRQQAGRLAGFGDPRMAQLEANNPDRFAQAQQIQRIAGNRGGVQNIPGAALRRIFGR